MPNGIGTRMEPMQAPRPNPPFDRFPGEPKLHQLPPSHHTMLPRCQLSNLPIIPASPRKPLLRTG